MSEPISATATTSKASAATGTGDHASRCQSGGIWRVDGVLDMATPILLNPGAPRTGVSVASAPFSAGLSSALRRASCRGGAAAAAYSVLFHRYAGNARHTLEGTECDCRPA